MIVAYRFRTADYAYTTQLKLQNLIGARHVNTETRADRANKCRIRRLTYRLSEEDALAAKARLTKHFAGVPPHQMLEVDIDD